MTARKIVSAIACAALCGAVALPGCSAADSASDAADSAQQAVDSATSAAQDALASTQTELEEALTGLGDSAANAAVESILGAAHSVTFSDAQTGGELAVLSDVSDVSAFITSLDVASWSPTSSAPDASTAQYTAAFVQEASSDSETASAELGTITSYADSNVLTATVSGMSVSFTVSEEAATAFRTAAGQ